jgi:cytochrome c oxidase subunit 2
MVLALSGCSKVSTLGFPEGVTSVNDISLPLWQGAWIAGGVVGVITLVLILWPAVFHRAKASKGEFPKQTQYNVPIEIVYTVIPFIIIAVMFYFTAVKQNEITEKSPNVAHEITVNGIQWSWQFGYPEAGENVVVTGTPEKPPTLVIPVGERVRYIITSSDVVHAFYVPAFMNQIQNLPGVTNQIEFNQTEQILVNVLSYLVGFGSGPDLLSIDVLNEHERFCVLESLKLKWAGVKLEENL